MPTAWTLRYDRLRELWPGVDPHDVCTVLAHLDAVGSVDTKARIAEALSRQGREAASALMAPVAFALNTIERAEKVSVLHALDALIRAGGDPTAALVVLASTLDDIRTVQPASAALHRAALAGYSLAPIREALSKAAAHHRSVRDVARLDALQRRGQHVDLRRLSAVYERQRPIGNLHGALGLLEDSLLSDVDAELTEARRALEEAERAGSDVYRVWVSFLPIMTRQLGAADHERRERAAAALAQVKFAVGRSPERSEREAAALALPLLRPTLDGLTALLEGEDAERMASAATIEVFVELGCPLTDVRQRLEVALGDARVEVRAACSRALSAALGRAGEEKPLPPGRSHRRTYASSDTPLEAGRKTRCPNCGALEALVIYESRDRGNTWDDTTVERKCGSCQIYLLERFGL